ncbi:hypothetical protein CMO92_00825 [Candidatus Woesearchaeota archaeon]|nr:hypothetical protein [Candidatus Woesearchaeota archaeon]
MTKNLKELDEDILEHIKKIHELVAEWSQTTKEEYKEKRLHDNFYEDTSRLKNAIEEELSTIYKAVMSEKEIKEHLSKINKIFEDEIGD